MRPGGTSKTLVRAAAALLAAAAVTATCLSATACESPAGGAVTTAAAPSTTAAAATADTAGRPAPASAAAATLFDRARLHTISVSFAQADYDAMVEAYKVNETKEWIEAAVTIDGATFQRVGMRLKGNSSLRGLANGRGQGPGGAVSATAPEGLPWLLRLDKNVKGQQLDGITDLVVRSNNTQTSLNEAVSLQLLEMAGLASVRAIPVSFTVNGGPAKLRLATELPDDTWMAAHFSASGALYKAEASGDYSYRGTDAKAYAEVFDQEAGKKNTDLAPLIGLLEFINNSDDATFAATLPAKLDVQAFAKYLAMEELIVNFDDIDGPGNNSYLYWDAATGRFTVVPWDHNLAFGALNAGQGGAPGGGPGGSQPGAPPGGPGGDSPDGPGAPGPRGKTNLLVTRFHANAEFEALYQKALGDLRQQLYASGAATTVLTGWVDVLKAQASGLVSVSTIESEAARISGYFAAR